MRAGRTLLLVVLTVCTAVLSACGDTTNNRNARNEGIYVDLGSLKYQVQLSRQLNPSDVEDASYLEGLAPTDQTLATDQTWFGVFLLTVNRHGQSHESAHSFYITDTQGSVYRPTPVPGSNPFAYHAIRLAANEKIPAPGSVAETAPTQGAVLLFKLGLAVFDNRPLILHISDPANVASQATVELDV